MTNALVEIVDLAEERFRSVAPDYMRYEAEKGYAIQILSTSDYLAKVAMENRASLAQAITNVAAIGLSLNPAEKLAYLIPRNVQVAKGKWESRIYLEPSYMGLCKLATSSGAIEWVQANCVYATDHFIDNGPGLRPTHEYNAFAKDRGEFVGVYCVAKTSSGDYLTTIMPADEVNSIRDRSETYKKHKSGPWVTDFNEQAKKSVVRRAFKMWPSSTGDRMAEAVHISNENEGFAPILHNPEISDYTADQKAYYDQLITNNDAMGMYVFQRSLPAGVVTSLYHSFERPKGKYQQIVDGLYSKGEGQFTDYINAINAAGSDEAGIVELVAELEADALELMLPQLSDDARAIIRESGQ